jgi:hypothetical protein
MLMRRRAAVAWESTASEPSLHPHTHNLSSTRPGSSASCTLPPEDNVPLPTVTEDESVTIN